MKLILTTSVDNLGVAGDIVEVKAGYGRNYLLPRGFAIAATRGAEKNIETIKRAQEARTIRDLDHAKEVKAELEALDNVKIPVRSAEGGRLFGSVTERDVLSAVKATNGRQLERNSIKLPKNHIKSTGRYVLDVTLHPEVDAKLGIEVVAE
ncbi:50S ribosomal protein L9 [Corynebacterium heidelbergense]|uniref:Large ribosomal subunit protein bL9 n=1 Tax=Corynebacterium heidelbergense TaxID=2055947 RepID=A0A364V3S0_9CORY|nr:50S ribosomal protein L9 [Corynebacterium heidelbergense]RAV31271.1 50S ribosomal protein L9 [Corynebacterium heidelbergense]